MSARVVYVGKPDGAQTARVIVTETNDVVVELLRTTAAEAWWDPGFKCHEGELRTGSLEAAIVSLVASNTACGKP